MKADAARHTDALARVAARIDAGELSERLVTGLREDIAGFRRAVEGDVLDQCSP